MAGAGPGRGGGAGDAGVGRVPPHDLSAEKAVLAALLLDNSAFDEITAEVKPEDFYHPAHQIVYKAMVAIHDDEKPVDLITLSSHLNAQKRLDAIGGTVYLGEIADFEATAANVVHHARIVRDKAVKRHLIQVATEIVEVGYEESDAAERLLDVAESKIFDISKEKGRTRFASLHDEMQGTFDYVEAIMGRGGELTGIPTGFGDFDKMTGGLQPGELIIIASRPSMGKTALALNMACHAALHHQKKVAFFSLEMTTRSLILRLLASEAEIDLHTLRSGFLPTYAFEKLAEAGSKLSQAEIWIDDSGVATILEIKAKCRRLKAERGLDLVMVDYLQLASADGPRDRKDLEIAEISRGLKALAKELQLPVVALSQLNRGPEQRNPDQRRPILGDLRESGAIEQDADLIAFIYRDVVYNKETEDPNLAELDIAKQRNGPTGTVKLHFEGKCAHFKDRSERADGAPPPGGSFVIPREGGFGGEDLEDGDPFDDEPPF
jgi:replicative DNA helicase